MNKSKKTPILLVIALIICMGLTAGLTMAFFGGTSTGSSTVTLKTGVKVGATATASNDGAMVVPGQPIDISAEAVVEPYSSTGTIVPALLRLKFTIGGAMDVTPTLNTTDAMTIKTEAGDATGYWVLNESDGYYYLCAEAAEATVANTQLLKFTPVNTTTEEDKTKVSLTGNFVVPTSLGNEYSGQSLDINARFEVIQAEIYANGSDTALTDENLTIGNEAVQEVFGEFGEKPVYLNYLSGETVVSTTKFNGNTANLSLSNIAVDTENGYVFIPVQFTGLTYSKLINLEYVVETGIEECENMVFSEQIDNFEEFETAQSDVQKIINTICVAGQNYMDFPDAEVNGSQISIDTNFIVKNNDVITFIFKTNLTTFNFDATLTMLDNEIQKIEYQALLDNEDEIVLNSPSAVSVNVSSLGLTGANYASVYNLDIVNVPENTEKTLFINFAEYAETATLADFAFANGYGVYLSAIAGFIGYAGIGSVDTGLLSTLTKDTVYSFAITSEQPIPSDLQPQIIIKPIENTAVVSEENGPVIMEFDQEGKAEVLAEATVQDDNKTVYYPIRFTNLTPGKIITISPILLSNYGMNVVKPFEDFDLFEPAWESNMPGLIYNNSQAVGVSSFDFTDMYVPQGVTELEVTLRVKFYDNAPQEKCLTLLSYTLEDVAPITVNFADINNAEFTTYTITEGPQIEHGWDYNDWNYQIDRIYNISITNITQNCVLEVEILNNVEGYSEENIISTSIYDQFIGGGEFGLTSKTSFNLTAGQDFQLGIREYLDRSRNYAEFTETFKINIKITPSA